MVSLSNEEIEKAGKRSGLEIWRIENMKMVPVSSKHHGHFFVGDSYIVLHTERQETGETRRLRCSNYLADLHVPK